MTDQGDDIEDVAVQGESRLARWSRRKHEQQSSPPSDTQELEQLDQHQEQQTPLVEQSDAAVDEIKGEDKDKDKGEQQAPLLTDADMPSVASLDAASDFSGFMSPGVSEELRRLALRKLFALPNFKVRDGLDDYDDDFTVFEPLGDTVTNDPWTHRQQRLAEEREQAAQKAAQETEQQPETAAEDVENEQENDSEDDAGIKSAETASAQQSESERDDVEQDQVAVQPPAEQAAPTSAEIAPTTQSTAATSQETSPEDGSINE